MALLIFGLTALAIAAIYLVASRWFVRLLDDQLAAREHAIKEARRKAECQRRMMPLLLACESLQDYLADNIKPQPNNAATD